MSHLSSGQISEWILGEHDIERNSEIELHVRTCDQCQREIALLKGGLLAFRESVREWAAESAVVSVATIPARRVSWRWAAGAAAVLTAVLVPSYLEVRQTQHEAKTAQDSLLLNEVQAHLARTVPQPLEHLMELMNEEMHEEKRGPQ